MSILQKGSTLPGSRLVLLVLTATIVLPGIYCNPIAAAEQKYEIERKFTRGPATLIIKIDKKELTIAERINLLLQVKIKEEYEIKMPKFGEKLEQFGIVDFNSPPARLLDNKIIMQEQMYKLEPFLSGEYKIPSFKVYFWKKGQKKQYEVSSEEITITVKSLLPEKIAKLKIRDIAEPVELPEPARVWLYALIALIIIIIIMVVIVIKMRKKRAHQDAVQIIPPHEAAFAELEKLLAEDLIASGDIKNFYLRISGILRHYIENRFGLNAPENTTEEFLLALQYSSTLSTAHKELLGKFLKHCDLVKFAEHHPDTEEIQKTFDICKEFILETKTETAA